jgi:Flp pilus assembly protein CpaB
MKLNKRMTFGIISIILAALVALIGIPAVIGQANAKTNIVRVKANIERGSVITAEQVEMVQVSANGLPDGVATEYTQILGKYALVDLVVGDYFLPTKVSSMSPDTVPVATVLPRRPSMLTSPDAVRARKLAASSTRSSTSPDMFSNLQSPTMVQ